MAGKYWDELKPGDKFVTAAKTVTRTAIDLTIALGQLTEPMFIDEEFANKKRGGLMAPGPLTMLTMMGLWQQAGIIGDTGMGFLGFDKVKFVVPVHAGDTISVEIGVLEKRETAKPESGLVRWQWFAKNQRNEVVAQMESATLVKRKS
jgi:acyl dehydratase